MSILNPPVSDYSVDGLGNQAEASGSWWEALPKTDWKILTYSLSRKNHDLVFTNFGSGEKSEANDTSNVWGGLRGTGLFEDHAIKGRANVFQAWKTYRALGYLLVAYDAYLSQLTSDIETGSGTNFTYRDYEAMSGEFVTFRDQVQGAWSSIAAQLPPLYGKNENPYIVIPPAWADGFVLLQNSFGHIMEMITGQVDNFQLEKAKADLEDHQRELAEAQALLAQQREIQRVEQEQALAELQQQALLREASLKGEALQQELDDREYFLYNFGPDVVKDWSNSNDARDQATVADIAKWAGIPLAEVAASANTPESRETMASRINNAIFSLKNDLLSGSALLDGWEVTPTGLIYKGKVDVKEDASSSGDIVAAATSRKGLLILGGIAAAFFFLRKR